MPNCLGGGSFVRAKEGLLSEVRDPNDQDEGGGPAIDQVPRAERHGTTILR